MDLTTKEIFPTDIDSASDSSEVLSLDSEPLVSFSGGMERPPPPPYPPPPDSHYDKLRKKGLICPRSKLTRPHAIKFSHLRELENGKAEGCPISGILWQGMSQMKLLDLARDFVVRLGSSVNRPLTVELGRPSVGVPGLSQWVIALEFYNSNSKLPEALPL